MVFILFILFTFVPVFLFLNKKYTVFLFCFLSILFIEPAIQKMVDPTLLGDTFNIFGFDRVKTNLALIFSLFLIITFQTKSINSTILPLGKFFIFIFIYLIFQILNIINSIEQTNTIILTLVSVLGPVLLFIVIINIPEHFFKNSYDFFLPVLTSIVVFLGMGMIMYYYTSGKFGDEVDVFNRSGGGLWMSNVSTQVLAPLFPLIFIKNNHKYFKILKLVLIGLFVLLLIVSLSRTGISVYLAMLILVFWKIRGKLKFILLGFFLLFIALSVINSFFNINVIEMFEDRFFMKGEALETVKEDARFEIYDEAYESILSRPLFGTGLGSFFKVSSSGFSNAHNIFLNILVERGIIGFSFLILFILFFLKSNSLCKKISLPDDKETFRLIKIGFLGFFLIGMTGNDLFISSGFVTGWPMYILVLLLSYQLGYLNSRLKIIRSQKHT